MGLGINIPNVIVATIMLIFTVLLFAVAFLGFFWLIYRGGTVFIKWLSHRKFFVQFRRECQEWWDKNKVAIVSFWEFVSEVLVDPAFYGYVLVTLYQRLQAIGEYAKVYPQYGFWQLLDLDTRTHMQYYTVLLIIFILWMFWRAWKHNQEVRFQKNINTKLDKMLGGIESHNKQLLELLGANNEDIKQNSEDIKQNSEDIKQAVRSIQQLTEEIRRGRQNKNGKSPTDM